MELIESDFRRLRCRLCFHSGTNAQLIEVFNKNHDLSKRIISALGVKINRSEKQARVCTVCETIIDIIQSFQAVCKQTNQLHHSRTDFLLYDTFWDSREQDAVKVTEKIILSHRSEVDKVLSRTTTVPSKKETECTPSIEILPVNPHLEVDVAKEEPLTKIPATEVVICEPTIKDESIDGASQLLLQSELEETIATELEQSDCFESDSDIKPEKEETKPVREQTVVNECDRPKKRGRKPRIFKFTSEKTGNENQVQTDEDQSEEDYEPKIPGKRGPRRKKVRKSDPSVCEICGQTVAHFIKESHHNQHLGVRPYKCDFEGCGRTYFSQNDLRTHSKRHQITYHVCEICGRNIKGVEWFRRHVKTHTEGPQFTCEVCGTKFRRKAQLQTHMVTHTGLTPHECEVCGKRFALKYNLEAHVKRHQKKESPGKVVNEASKEIVPEKRTWKYYVRSENSDLKHHVTCETCGKSVHKREIEGHVNKHLDRRPYSCDEPGCTMAFYGLRGIKEHKMVVHSDKILRYDCSICNRSIKGAGTFKRHVIMHNSNMKVECQHCGKKFTSKSYLKAHEQKHSGERPYVCDLCGRSFAMKPCWKTHMKTVHNEDHRDPTRVRKQESEVSDKQVDPNEPLNTAFAVEKMAKAIVVNSETLQQESSTLQEAPLISSKVLHYQAPESSHTNYSYCSITNANNGGDIQH